MTPPRHKQPLLVATVAVLCGLALLVGLTVGGLCGYVLAAFSVVTAGSP